MLCLSTSAERVIRSCNVNYFPDGEYHPRQLLKEYDFLYIKTGAWHVCEDDAVFPIRDGHLLILEPQKHLSSLDKCSPGMKNMYIHCSCLPEDFTLSASDPPVWDDPKHVCLEKLIDCSGNPKIESLFLQIIETYWTPSLHKSQLLDALFFLLLTELEKTGKSRMNHDPMVSEILHLFYAHSEQMFSLAELANQFNISIRSLSGRFKAATGMSVHQYQLNMKLDIAQEQLRINPDRYIRELALSLGFYDEFHFSKLFKRRFGYAPSSNRYL